MSSKIRYRLAEVEDAEAIASLHAESWRSSYRGVLCDAYLTGDVEADRQKVWRERLAHPRGTQYLLVAEKDQELLGFACAYLNEDQRWGTLLDNLHVARNQHRGGIGSRLLAGVAVHSGLHAPASGMYLWVVESNTGAQAFYLRHHGQNTGADLWDAPDGTRVPCFRFAWEVGKLPR
ncbi:MAG: GNAT family N-acetyltransferase [Gemmatimonadota bacterium]|nr:GNAT family N-acetyltransferase [Gemmatimonadota bacterium]